jgi:hypothetical protein
MQRTWQQALTVPPGCPGTQGRVTTSTLIAIDDVEAPVLDLDQAVHQEAVRGHTELRLAGGARHMHVSCSAGCVDLCGAAG